MMDSSGKVVGVEIRSGRPWFAVCCASCLLILVLIVIAIASATHVWSLPIFKRYL